jgi:uncharacterized membrane protein YagU involved in acid resistance
VSGLRTVLTAGLVAGAIDITAAFTIYALRGVAPHRILQSIASGLLGRAAFSGGFRTAALGLLLHFLIATTAAAVYFGASRKWGRLTERPILFGAIYGVAVYAFMNHVVVPLSAVTKRPFDPGMAALMVGVHIACVGVPIAVVVRRLGAVAPRASEE